MIVLIWRNTIFFSAKSKKKKKFKAQILCACKKDCATQVDVVRQREIFDNFSNLTTWSAQTRFIRTLVMRYATKRTLNPVLNLKPRKYYSEYMIKQENGDYSRVCSHFLSNLLQVTKVRIFRAIKSTVTNPNAVDRRGRLSARKVKMADIEIVKRFVEKFPQFEIAKLGMPRTTTQCLHPQLNMRKLYAEYSSERADNEETILAESTFRKIVNKNCGISFFTRSSQCKKCATHKKKLQPQILSTEHREKLLSVQHAHLQKAQLIKDDLADTVEQAMDLTEHTEIFTFDIQRALETPRFAVSGQAYSKKPMWLFNVCIFDEIRQKSHFYIWPEYIAKRGPEEIASVLIRHMLAQIPKETKKIVLFSSGKQRNIKMVLMLKKFFDMWPNDELKSIEQRFFLKGHTFNSCTRSFNLIERNAKKVGNIYTPFNWKNVIESAKSSEPKFVVQEMQRQQFYTCKPIEELLSSTKKSSDGSYIDWANIWLMAYEKNNPFKVMACNFEEKENMKIIMLCKKVPVYAFTNTNLLPKYSDADTLLSLDKFNDLQSILSQVPEQHHDFYKELPHNELTGVKDYGLYLEDTDEEHEEEI